MANAQSTRIVAAPPERVWEVIGDPHHMPRWWPGVQRMEGVEADRWTQVFTTKRGRPVRLDFHLLQSEPPWVRSWEQELVGTPFERVLQESITEIRLEPTAQGTLVTIAQRQKLRGYSRTGGFMLRRATRAKLAEALQGLERICG
ncbi:MAG: SRPBCC family protein [Solirubrobacterales bacterium]|nr:SRPBCC family protein [Solirubrobacterales bacterium]MBV9473807.1 SRPBCC family protein [Solirubrobacterales bacterium]MBV9838536.1 SRPBCC family protein [Solirubrobacterales bacterium]